MQYKGYCAVLDLRLTVCAGAYMSFFVCCTVYVCLAVSLTEFLTLFTFPLCLHTHPQTHRMLQRSTVHSSVRCFKSSMDTRPLSVWTGQGITTPCLTVIGYREVSDRNMAHPANLCFCLLSDKDQRQHTIICRCWTCHCGVRLVCCPFLCSNTYSILTNTEMHMPK